jgi:putative spermidine/putrescine transport system ATP-binding protein
MKSSVPGEAPFLQLMNITHFYGQKAVLQNVSLDVTKREVLALLGPSGSGKSTLLSVIAGIVKPRGGKIVLGGLDLLQLAPEARGLGMVFQDFALWPHMTVTQNVGFPLRVRKFARGEIKRLAAEALNRVGLEGFESRRPHELSGGQQQRVALADILRKLGLTTIIVTHDREEAFELADRIAILVDGKIDQHSRPEDAYERPANLTVAHFMGANLLPAQILSDGRAELNDGARSRLQFNRAAFEGAAHLSIVPEQTRVIDPRSGMTNTLQGRLLRTQYRGGEYRLQVRIGDAALGQIIEARSEEQPKGDSLYVHLPVEAIHIIQDLPLAGPAIAAEEPIIHPKLTKLQEELA